VACCLQVADYQLTIDEDMVHGLLVGDRGLARLLEQVLNQILEGQARPAARRGPLRTDRGAAGLSQWVPAAPGDDPGGPAHATGTLGAGWHVLHRPVPALPAQCASLRARPARAVSPPTAYLERDRTARAKRFAGGSRSSGSFPTGRRCFDT
jgi:hypothetical protein